MRPNRTATLTAAALLTITGTQAATTPPAEAVTLRQIAYAESRDERVWIRIDKDRRGNRYVSSMAATKRLAWNKVVIDCDGAVFTVWGQRGYARGKLGRNLHGCTYTAVARYKARIPIFSYPTTVKAKVYTP